MRDLILANLRHHGRRYTATIVAVAISTAFVAAALVFGGTLNTGMKDQIAGQYNGAAAVVNLPYVDYESEISLTTEQVRDLIEDVPGVTETYPLTGASWDIQEPSRLKDSWTSATILGGQHLLSPNLIEGALPTDDFEALITDEAAGRLDLQVGSTLTLVGYTVYDEGENGEEPQTRELTISGITKSSSQSIMVGQSDLMVTTAVFDALNPGWQPMQILVAAEGGNLSNSEQDQLALQINAALANYAADLAAGGYEAPEVTTAYVQIDNALEDINSSQAAMTLMLLLFPIIAAVVALIVVGTTFQVIFKQREREIALLRLIGGTGKQVRKLMLLESLAVGFIGAAVGVALGILGGAAISTIAEVVGSFPRALGSVSLTQVAVVIIVAVSLTMFAGFRPAIRASQIPPIRALAGNVETVKSMSVRQRIVGVIALVAMVAFGLLAWRTALAPEEEKLDRFLPVLGLAVVTVAALITALSALLPLVTRLLGRFSSAETYRMAAANTARNPGRTASTGVAIFIGVALISMVTLGAQSLRVTANSAVDNSAPVDLIAQLPVGGVDSDTIAKFGEVEGLDGLVILNGVNFDSVTAEDGSVWGGTALSSEGIDSVVRGETYKAPAQGQIITPFLDDTGASQVISLCINEICKDFESLPSSTLSGSNRFIMNPADLESFGVTLEPMQVWMMLTDPADFQSVVGAVQEIDGNIILDGQVAERATINQIVNILVMVVVGLLAVSVLVALVGVTNTLSLSVAERQRENGLLRALGMTRHQVRSMLTWESLLISVVSTIIGLAAGGYFGYIGFLSLPLGITTRIVDVPWMQWGAILVIAILAGLLASIVPGRRASKVSPVEALAYE